MKQHKTIELIRNTGVIAIMRAASANQLVSVAGAVREGGIRAIEVTMTTPGALKVVELAVGRYGTNIAFGVGTVLDPETARAAILAGADFIVSPTLNLELLALCKRYGVPVLPGCFTPTEVLTAWEAGADLIKLFPANLGGPPLVKALRAPLPQVALVPVGGVTMENAAAYISQGAVALGVGSALVNQALVDGSEFGTITRRAALLLEEVRKGRGE